MHKKTLFIFGIFLITNLNAQDNSVTRYIHWCDSFSSGKKNMKLDFLGASYPDSINGFPYYKEQFSLPFYCKVVLSNIIFEKLDESIAQRLAYLSQIPDTFMFFQFAGKSRKKDIINISLLPVCRNRTTKAVYRLKSFSFSFPAKNIKKTLKTGSNYLSHSVLNSGKWYKIKLNKDGIYKITYSQLKEKMKFENPSNVRIYGNGGGMLPLKVNKPRPDDLRENAILYVDGGDGIFNEGDYILFYGQGPNIWNYDASKKHFFHSQHKFADYSYYFLTDYLGRGKTINDANESSSSNIDITSFDDYAYHESDMINLINSGSEWYGDKIDIYSTISFDFDFPNLNNSSTSYFYYDIIGRSSTSESYFSFGISGNEYKSTYIGNIDRLKSESDFAKIAKGSFEFSPASDNITVYIKYVGSGDKDAEGYINYFGLNVRRDLLFEGDQMHFRDINAIGAGNIAKYIINNASADVEVWDITDACVPLRMQKSFQTQHLHLQHLQIR